MPPAWSLHAELLEMVVDMSVTEHAPRPMWQRAEVGVLRPRGGVMALREVAHRRSELCDLRLPIVRFTGGRRRSHTSAVTP